VTAAAPNAEEVTLRTLNGAAVALVPEVWRSAWEGLGREPYPLEDRVWRERLARHHQPELLIGAFADEHLVGAAYGRLPDGVAWLPADVGWVSLLAVAGPWQGSGVGGRLLSELLARLRAGGAKRFRLGSDANHLLPGPPQESFAALWRLARRAGARFLASEHDLHVDLRLPLPPAPLPPGWTVRADEPAAALEFVARAFPGRWAHEVEAYLGAGATVLTLAKASPGGTGPSALAEGFCALFQGDEALVAPSLYWRRAVAANGGAANVAGMGPLGVSESARGLGLGLSLVRAGAAWLQDRGATDLLINWTTLTTFYGKLGARVWRTYQRAEGPL